MFIQAPCFSFGNSERSSSEMSSGFGRARRGFLGVFCYFLCVAQSKLTFELLQGVFNQILIKVCSEFIACLF